MQFEELILVVFLRVSGSSLTHTSIISSLLLALLGRVTNHLFCCPVVSARSPCWFPCSSSPIWPCLA